MSIVSTSSDTALDTETNIQKDVTTKSGSDPRKTLNHKKLGHENSATNVRKVRHGHHSETSPATKTR